VQTAFRESRSNVRRFFSKFHQNARRDSWRSISNQISEATQSLAEVENIIKQWSGQKSPCGWQSEKAALVSRCGKCGEDGTEDLGAKWQPDENPIRASGLCEMPLLQKRR